MLSGRDGVVESCTVAMVRAGDGVCVSSARCMLDLAVRGLEASPAGSSSSGLPWGGYGCGGRGQGLVVTCVADSDQTLSALASGRRHTAQGGGARPGVAVGRCGAVVTAAWWLHGLCRAHGSGVNPARIWHGGRGGIPLRSTPTTTSVISCELA